MSSVSSSFVIILIRPLFHPLHPPPPPHCIWICGFSETRRWCPASLVPELVVIFDKLHIGGGHLGRLRGEGSASRGGGGGGVHSAQLTLVQRAWPHRKKDMIRMRVLLNEGNTKNWIQDTVIKKIWLRQIFPKIPFLLMFYYAKALILGQNFANVFAKMTT